MSHWIEHAPPPWEAMELDEEVRPAPALVPPPVVEHATPPLTEHELVPVVEVAASPPEFEPMLAELEAAEVALRTAAATLARARDAIRAAIEQSATLEATEETLAACERDLTAARAAGERERELASELQGELSRRNDLFTTLRSKLRDLLGTVEADSGPTPTL